MTHPQDTGPNQRLPDFKPRGMGKWDKIAMWTLIFLVVIFGLGWVSQNYGKGAHTPKPAATVTATPKATVKPKATATPAVYVVENTASGYIWWLDANGSQFTQATAAKFAKGHAAYHVFVLKRS